MAKLWTDEKVEILKKYYPTKGAEFVAKKLGLTEKQIRSKVAALKLKKVTWTAEQDAILREYYPTFGAAITAEKVGKTVTAVRSRCQLLKIKYIPWTDEELKILREYYPDNGSVKTAEKLNKSRTTVKSMAQSLGIRYIGWSEKDILFAKRHYPMKGAEYVAEHINKTPGAVRTWAHKNNIPFIANTWTTKEDNILRQYYPQGGYLAVLKHLPNRSGVAIKSRACALNIKTECFFWIPEEDEFLIRTYGILSTEMISEKTGRTPQSIRHRAIKLGLKHYKEWTPEEDELLIDNMNNMTMTALMDKFERRRWDISNRIRTLGYTRNYYDEGYYSCREVGEIIGVSARVVLERMKQLGGKLRPNTVKFEQSNRILRRFTPRDIIKFLYLNQDLWIDKLDEVDKYEINTLCLDEEVKKSAHNYVVFIKSVFNDTYWRKTARLRGEDEDMVI